MRRSTRFTVVPALPRISFTASSVLIPLVLLPSIETITSLGCTPAREAGEPSIGEITTSSLVSLSTLSWMPTPESSPEVSICISLNSRGSRKRV